MNPNAIRAAAESIRAASERLATAADRLESEAARDLAESIADLAGSVDALGTALDEPAPAETDRHFVVSLDGAMRLCADVSGPGMTHEQAATKAMEQRVAGSVSAYRTAVNVCEVLTDGANEQTSKRVALDVKGGKILRAQIVA